MDVEILTGMMLIAFFSVSTIQKKNFETLEVNQISLSLSLEIDFIHLIENGRLI
jgi:hypothetical protein